MSSRGGGDLLGDDENECKQQRRKEALPLDYWLVPFYNSGQNETKTSQSLAVRVVCMYACVRGEGPIQLVTGALRSFLGQMTEGEAGLAECEEKRGEPFATSNR